RGSARRAPWWPRCPPAAAPGSRARSSARRPTKRRPGARRSWCRRSSGGRDCRDGPAGRSARAPSSGSLRAWTACGVTLPHVAPARDLVAERAAEDDHRLRDLRGNGRERLGEPDRVHRVRVEDCGAGRASDRQAVQAPAARELELDLEITLNTTAPRRARIDLARADALTDPGRVLAIARLGLLEVDDRLGRARAARGPRRRGRQRGGARAAEGG